MSLREESINNINETLLLTIGISYEEYEKLDFDRQQEIIRKYHKNNKKSKDNLIVMVGSGEDSCFVSTQKGKCIMIDDGVIIETGLTLEESRQRLDDRCDDVMYSKPVATVKNL